MGAVETNRELHWHGQAWNSTCTTHVSKAAVKDIERAVVNGRGSVSGVVLHLELDTVTLVVLAALEFLVAELLH